MAEQNILRQDPYMRDGEIDERVLEKISNYVQDGNIPPMFFRNNQAISPNILGLLQNRTTEEQVDPYAYGSYVIPASDPTYTSGFNYARTIAGGMPFEDVVAPGMSFSPEQPGGYTQADLNVVNLPRDVAPVFPTLPTKGEVYQPSEPMMPYAPTGTPMPEPLPNFFGQLPTFDPSQLNMFDFLGLDKIDFSNLPSATIEDTDYRKDFADFSMTDESPAFTFQDGGFVPVSQPIIQPIEDIRSTFTPKIIAEQLKEQQEKEEREMQNIERKFGNIENLQERISNIMSSAPPPAPVPVVAQNPFVTNLPTNPPVITSLPSITPPVIPSLLATPSIPRPSLQIDEIVKPIITGSGRFNIPSNRFSLM